MARSRGGTEKRVRKWGYGFLEREKSVHEGGGERDLIVWKTNAFNERTVAKWSFLHACIVYYKIGLQVCKIKRGRMKNYKYAGWATKTSADHTHWFTVTSVSVRSQAVRGGRGFSTRGNHVAAFACSTVFQQCTLLPHTLPPPPPSPSSPLRAAGGQRPASAAVSQF